MEFITVICPHCGSQTPLEATTKTSFCSYCGTKITLDPSQAAAPIPAYPQATAADAANTGSTVGTNGPSSCGYTWKTNVGGSILGVVAIMLLNTALGATNTFVLFGVTIASCVATLLYIFLGYAKFFNRLDNLPASSFVLSFLNFFFGGIIFGCLWNRCLTLRKKGCSHIVMAVFSSISIALMILSMILLASLATSDPALIEEFMNSTSSVY